MYARCILYSEIERHVWKNRKNLIAKLPDAVVPSGIIAWNDFDQTTIDQCLNHN